MIDELDRGSLVRIYTVDNAIYEGVVGDKDVADPNNWRGFVELKECKLNENESIDRKDFFINLSNIISFTVIKDGPLQSFRNMKQNQCIEKSEENDEELEEDTENSAVN